MTGKKKILFSILSIYLLTLCLMLINSQNSTQISAETGIVFGNKIELSGKPSKRLAARLNAAIKLFKDNHIKTIIVSGGIGKEGFDEALVMKNYLIENEIPQDKIIIDSNGYNTTSTCLNATSLINTDKGVVAISQQYHIPRAKLSLSNHGFKKVYGYSPSYYEFRDFYSYHREILAYITYWFQSK